jgi:hypothetical protein
MDKKSTYLIAGIILIAIAVFIGISFQKSTMDTLPPSTTEQTASTTAWENTPAESAPAVSQKTVVTAKHAYRNGVHTIAGEVPLPTPCHLLTSEAIVSPDKKQVLLQLHSSVKEGEMCAQVITNARFKVTAKALEKATIIATLNGQQVTLNLIEAGASEDLDAFDLYIKG